MRHSYAYCASTLVLVCGQCPSNTVIRQKRPGGTAGQGPAERTGTCRSCLARRYAREVARIVGRRIHTEVRGELVVETAGTLLAACVPGSLARTPQADTKVL